MRRRNDVEEDDNESRHKTDERSDDKERQSEAIDELLRHVVRT